MKATLSIIALVAALAIPSAMAQDLDLDAGVSAGAGGAGSVDTGAGDVSAGAGADANVDATVTGSINSGDIGSVDDLTAAMQSSLTADIDFSALSEADIFIVEVSSLEASASGSGALQSAIDANADSLASLHASLEANAAINAKLEAAGYDSTDVVAVVESEAAGSITLYVDDSV
jgi:hypothetical protein